MVEYLAAIFWALLIGLSVIILTIGLRLIGSPGFVYVIAPSAVLLLPPFYIGKRLTHNWTRYAKEYSERHPTSFLSALRDSRVIGYEIEFGSIILIVMFVRGVGFTGLSLQSLVDVSVVEFALIELVFIVISMNSWNPEPKSALLAALRSDSDPERTPGTSFLDAAILYFNSALKSRKSLVRLKSGLSLEASLYDSPQREVPIDLLIYATKRDDASGFIARIAEITEKPVVDILVRPTIGKWIADNFNTILSVLGLIPLAAPFLDAYVNQLIQAWTNFLNLLH